VLSTPVYFTVKYTVKLRLTTEISQDKLCTTAKQKENKQTELSLKELCKTDGLSEEKP
jgi:hypothetical protein